MVGAADGINPVEGVLDDGGGVGGRFHDLPFILYGAGVVRVSPNGNGV